MRNATLRAWFGLFSCVNVALVAAAGLTGCVGAEPASEQQVDTVQNVAVSAESVAALPSGEHLGVDLRPAHVIYHFKLQEPIDFSRVDLIATTGAKASMETVIRRMQAESLDPLASLDKRFLISADPGNFRELRAAELQELQETGKLVIRGSAHDRPQATPQTVDDCVPETLYVEVEIEIDGVIYTFWCVHVIPCEDEPPPTVPGDEPPPC
jgi:hypothetical protein